MSVNFIHTLNNENKTVANVVLSAFLRQKQSGLSKENLFKASSLFRKFILISFKLVLMFGLYKSVEIPSQSLTAIVSY